MKNSKNIVLLIGIISVVMVNIWQIVNIILKCFDKVNGDIFKNHLFLNILPIAVILLLLLVPFFLLLRNFKGKTKKALPIISIVINSFALLWVLFVNLTPAIPKYLVYSTLGLIDTYYVVVIQFLGDGGLLFIIGYTALIVGSAMSLSKKGENRA